MNCYTYSEARQNLAKLLDEAQRDGEVLILRRDGQTFALRPIAQPSSALEVGGVDLGLSRDDILEAIREGRKFE